MSTFRHRHLHTFTRVHFEFASFSTSRYSLLVFSQLKNASSSFSQSPPDRLKRKGSRRWERRRERDTEAGRSFLSFFLCCLGRRQELVDGWLCSPIGWPPVPRSATVSPCQVLVPVLPSLCSRTAIFSKARRRHQRIWKKSCWKGFSKVDRLGCVFGKACCFPSPAREGRVSSLFLI